MEPVHAFAAAAALTAGLCGFYATAHQFMRVWKGEMHVSRSVKEEQEALRQRIRSKNWTGFLLALVLTVLAALTALTMFAPLAAMFVFPRDSALGRFLGVMSAFGVLLGLRCLIYWLRFRSW